MFSSIDGQTQSCYVVLNPCKIVFGDAQHVIENALCYTITEECGENVVGVVEE